MDDLLNLASKTMEGFNPATDSVDNFEEIADGTYNCVLDDVTARKNDKGTNWVSFKFSILDGDYANRLIFVSYFFTEKMAERSLKGIVKLGFDFGYEIPIVDIFSQYEGIEEQLKALAETLQGMAGNTATVTKSTSKNNFATYKVTPVE